MNQNLGNSYILSIVTVVYNDAENIEKTLKSIQNIKSSQIQYIVVDGASNDGTLKILHNYISIIDMLTSEPDKGIYYAMNKGINYAEGNSLIFMNSGDTFHNNFNPIKTITKYDYTNLTIIGFSLQTYREDIYLRPAKDKISILKKNPAHQAIFVPKNKYSKIKYELNYKIASDYYWIKDVIRDNKFVIIDDIITIFSLGGKSTSKKFKDILLMNKEMKLKYPYLLSIIKFVLFNIIGRKNSFRILYKNKYELLK